MSRGWLVLKVVVVLGAMACGHRSTESGVASWYGDAFRGKPTASGEAFRPAQRTAAHRTLPFGTVVKVHNPATGQSVRVVVNDRGPFVAGRTIDLSKRAARRIGLLDAGVGEVEITVVGCRDKYGGC